MSRESQEYIIQEEEHFRQMSESLYETPKVGINLFEEHKGQTE